MMRTSEPFQSVQSESISQLILRAFPSFQSYCLRSVGSAVGSAATAEGTRLQSLTRRWPLFFVWQSLPLSDYLSLPLFFFLPDLSRELLCFCLPQRALLRFPLAAFFVCSPYGVCDVCI